MRENGSCTYVVKLEGCRYVRLDYGDVDWCKDRLEYADHYSSEEDAIHAMKTMTNRINNGYPFLFTIEKVYRMEDNK